MLSISDELKYHCPSIYINILQFTGFQLELKTVKQKGNYTNLSSKSLSWGLL